MDCKRPLHEVGIKYGVQESRGGTARLGVVTLSAR